MTTKQFTIRLFTLIFALSVFTFSSCKKKEDEPVIEPTPPPPTKTELLTGKNWRLTAFICDPPYDFFGTGTPISNVYAQFSPCDKDDILLFKTNNTYVQDEGATKCNTGDPQIIATGPWTFNSTESIITQDAGTSNSQDFNILQLDATTLKGTIIIPGSPTYTYTLTYTNQ